MSLTADHSVKQLAHFLVLSRVPHDCEDAPAGGTRESRNSGRRLPERVCRSSFPFQAGGERRSARARFSAKPITSATTSEPGSNQSRRKRQSSKPKPSLAGSASRRARSRWLHPSDCAATSPPIGSRARSRISICSGVAPSRQRQQRSRVAPSGPRRGCPHHRRRQCDSRQSEVVRPIDSYELKQLRNRSG